MPFFCDVVIGEPLGWCGSRSGFMTALESRMQALAAELDAEPWE